LGTGEQIVDGDDKHLAKDLDSFGARLMERADPVQEIQLLALAKKDFTKRLAKRIGHRNNVVNRLICL
jgi:hypothetical protein